MIKVKLKDWVEIYNLVHTSTIWELATDPQFKNIIYTKEDTVHLSFFQYDIDIPLDMVYYLRARKQMNYGTNEVVSETIVIESQDTLRDNVILERDIGIDHPTVYVDPSDVETKDTIRITTSDFRANNDQHAYTHWIIEDGSGKVLFKSLYDKANLTSIYINNVGQPYSSKAKLVFRAIHGTKVGAESKIGNFTIFFKNVNFEIVQSLTKVTAQKDLVIKFRKIDPSIRLGISKIDIIDPSNDTTLKTYYDITEEGITLNWWLLHQDTYIIMKIYAMDINENTVIVNKKISVQSYENEMVKDPFYKYDKVIGSFYSTDEDESSDFYIPNHYISEALHNNNIPIPKRGVDETRLYAYTLLPNKKLKLLGDFRGISIEKDKLKSGMLIKRINNDLVLISHTINDEGLNKHEMMFYKHNVGSGDYSLIKKFVIDNEQYGLGYSNSLIQYDNKTLYYIPYKTDKLKKITLDMYTVEMVSEDIPYVVPYSLKDLNDENHKYISPTMVRLDDGRILITGGYSAQSCTFDPYTNTFQESIFWEQESFVGNLLNSSSLINGDAIILKTEDEDRELDQSLENLYGQKDITFVKSLDEVYKEVNSKPDIKQTVFQTDLTDYNVRTGESFEIILTNNFETDDIRQYYLIYDKKALRLDERTTNKLVFYVLPNNRARKKQIRIIASKEQLFEQENYHHTQIFTHSVIDLNLNIEITRDAQYETSMENVVNDENRFGYYHPILAPTDAEHLYILGEKLLYASKDKTIKVYKEDKILLPIELVNIEFKHLEFLYNKDLEGLISNRIIVKNSNLILLELSNINIDAPFLFTIKNKLKNAEFVTLRFEFLPIPAQGLPIKASIIRNKIEYLNQSTLSFMDLVSYPLKIKPNVTDPRFTFNRSNLMHFSQGANINEYMLNIRKKGLVPLIVSHAGIPEDIYSNTFFYINSIDAVPKIDKANPDLKLKINETMICNFLNDWGTYDPDSIDDAIELTITKNEAGQNLIETQYEKGKLIITVGDRIGNGVLTIRATNKADNVLKQSSFNFTVYDTDTYPVGLRCDFPDSSTGLSGENIYLLPGSSTPFTYTATGNPVSIDLPRGSIFNVDETVNNLLISPKLYLIGSRDLGRDTAVFKFYNRNNTVISSLTKNIFMVPIVFYTRDSFKGDVVIDQYPFTVQNGEETEFRIIPKSKEGYRVTSLKVISKLTYMDIRYYLEAVNDTEGSYKFVIYTPHSEEDKEFEFILTYGYVNNNGNDVLTVTQEYFQSFKVKSKYYKPQSFINLETNRITMHKNETRKINYFSNGEFVAFVPGEPHLLSVDNEAKTVTAKQLGRASLIALAGGSEQKDSQDLMYIDVIEEEIEEQKDQGILELNPEEFRLYPGSSRSISFYTTADNVECSVENPRIASYDSINKTIVGKEVGNTKLKVVFTGKNIIGGTKYFNIKILPLPSGDPDIMYYDKFNHSLEPTNIFFTDIYPNSILKVASGELILGCFIGVENKNKTFSFRSYYTIFS